MGKGKLDAPPSYEDTVWGQGSVHVRSETSRLDIVLLMVLRIGRTLQLPPLLRSLLGAVFKHEHDELQG